MQGDANLQVEHILPSFPQNILLNHVAPSHRTLNPFNHIHML